MAITKYEAAFTTSEGAEFIAVREYARPLAYAWRVEYTANQICSVKFGFSATKEAAEKSLKLPKRCTVTHSQVVEAKAVGTVASKAKAPKTKAVKPCAVNDLVQFDLATHIPGVNATVAGVVEKVGRKFAYIKVAGALDPIKVAFANINPQSPEAQPLAVAA
jgi:hypothetical protein